MSLFLRKINVLVIVEEVFKVMILLKDSMFKLFFWGFYEVFVVIVVKNNFVLDKCWYIMMEVLR